MIKNTLSNLYSDEIVTETVRPNDLERYKVRSKRVGLTRGLLGASLLIIFGMGYYFMTMPGTDSPNWLGAATAAITGYIVYRAFEDLEEHENHTEFIIRRIESAKRMEEIKNK